MIRLFAGLIFAMLFCFSSVAISQAARTWVSGVGDDEGAKIFSFLNNTIDGVVLSGVLTPAGPLK